MSTKCHRHKSSTKKTKNVEVEKAHPINTIRCKMLSICQEIFFCLFFSLTRLKIDGTKMQNQCFTHPTVIYQHRLWLESFFFFVFFFKKKIFGQVKRSLCIFYEFQPFIIRSFRKMSILWAISRLLLLCRHFEWIHFWPFSGWSLRHK